jgi:iron complex transport system substrate-binding protein
MIIRYVILIAALTSPLARPGGRGGEGGPQQRATEIIDSTVRDSDREPYARWPSPPTPLPLAQERGVAGASKAHRLTTKPQRIVSTNVCADQLALALADRTRIVSVSRMAIEPQISNYADAARGIPINHARAEEIVELKPDLILGDIYTGKGANRLAGTLGVPVHIVGIGSSLDDVRNVIREAARALGETDRGAAMIAQMDQRIARAQSATAKTLTALVYEPNGVTSSSGTLTDEVLKAAGLRNIAPTLMSGSYGTVPLEAVVASAPQLLILDDSYTGTSSRAQSILRHPAFRSLEGRTTLYHMPSRLWLCPGPWVAEAVERLAAERARLARTLAPKPERE